MVTKLLERAIEIEGLLRIIRDGNPLPETYTMLSNKAVDLAEEAMLLEELASASETEESKEKGTLQSDIKQESYTGTIEMHEDNLPSVEASNEEATNADAADEVKEPAIEEMTNEQDEADEEEIQEESSHKEPEKLPNIPMIDMTGNPDPIKDDEEDETKISPQPIIIAMVSEESTTKKETPEELSESEEEDIEDLPDVSDIKIASPAEDEKTHSSASFQKNAEEEDDILLNFEDEEETNTNYKKEEATFDITDGDKSDLEIKEESSEADFEISKEKDPLTEKKDENETPTIKRQKKLKSAFSLNDRFLYARELFDGNMKMFDSTLDFIEGIEYYSIIEDYFYNELEWDPENGTVTSFMETLRPQFKD